MKKRNKVIAAALLLAATGATAKVVYDNVEVDHITDPRDIFFPVYAKRTCPICGMESSVKILRSDLWIYENGKYDYLDISPEDKEMLKTGICPDCQAERYEEDKEDDEGVQIDTVTNATGAPVYA